MPSQPVDPFADTTSEVQTLPPEAQPEPEGDAIPPASAVSEDKTTVNAPFETYWIHFLEDGFTALGALWVRGQELEVTEKVYKDTQDRNGDSWLDQDDDTQFRRYGRVMFRRGHWPGLSWEDQKAAEAERKRAGKVPRPPRD